MASEIRETIMIAVSAILLSSLLGFIAYLLMLRGDFAEVRNSEIHTTSTIANFKEFNMYNGNTTLYGEDVVAAIRNYYDSDIKILVKNDTGNHNYNKQLVRANPAIVDIPTLQTLFTVNKKYKAVLVYGQVDLATVTETPSTTSGIDTRVSGIVFFHKGAR